jgi:hypothetical protein
VITEKAPAVEDSSAVSSAEREEEEVVEEERAVLDRSKSLRSLSLQGEGGPVSDLAALLSLPLPPALQAALLDDAHDIQVRVARLDLHQRQQLAGSKRARRSSAAASTAATTASATTAVASSASNEGAPAEVFLSAAPALSSSSSSSSLSSSSAGAGGGTRWSIDTIMHEPAFVEFMLRQTPSNKRKKYMQQLTYNGN